MSEYTDEKNNTYHIKNTVLLTAEEKEQVENKIVEALYRVFKQK